MKIDQLAFHCPQERHELRIKQRFNLVNAAWIKDVVTSHSTIYSPGGGILSSGHNVALLQFNYDLGIELEIIKYIGGENFLSDVDEMHPCFSHVGIHLSKLEEMPNGDDNFSLLQETFTISHTSDFLTNPSSIGYGRRYHYRIFEMKHKDRIKYIKRIHPAPITIENEKENAKNS